jgi:hypothetical protein
MEEILASLIKEKGITMAYIPGAPTHIIYPKAPGFTVTLKCNSKTMRFPYHTGWDEIDLTEAISYLLIRSEALLYTFPQYCK